MNDTKVLIFALIYKPLEHSVPFTAFLILQFATTGPYSESSLFKNASFTVLLGMLLLHNTLELYYLCRL